jgi:hypothetical protein
MKITLDQPSENNWNTVNDKRIEKSSCTGRIINPHQPKGIKHNSWRRIINLVDQEVDESTPLRRVINLFKEKVQESTLTRRAIDYVLEE